MPETHDPKTYAVFDHPRNKKLFSELENAGCKIVKIPYAELIKIESSLLNLPIEEVRRFDWIIFTDVYAADLFLEYLNENNFDLFELDALHICALGEAVAERLRFAQIHTDVIPVVNDLKKIFESIENYIYGDGNFAGKRFLLLKEADEKYDFGSFIEQMNGEVREASIYRAKYTSANEFPKIKALVKGGAVDEIIFTAPEDMTHCRFFFRDSNMEENLSEAKISATDEATRRALYENRFSATVYLRIK
jgi:uroporphyrinogen-III synthase